MKSYTFSYTQEGKFIYIHIVPLIDICIHMLHVDSLIKFYKKYISFHSFVYELPKN